MPRPQGVICDICNGEFFKRSFAIHRKACEKKYNNEHQACKHCGRKVHVTEINQHQMLCKKQQKEFKKMQKEHAKQMKKAASKASRSIADEVKEMSPEEREEMINAMAARTAAKPNTTAHAPKKKLAAGESDVTNREAFIQEYGVPEKKEVEIKPDDAYLKRFADALEQAEADKNKAGGGGAADAAATSFTEGGGCVAVPTKSDGREADGRIACRICTRKFQPMRIEKHEMICFASAQKKNRRKVKVKTGEELRIKGTEFNKYKNCRAPDPEHTTTKNVIWRKLHNELRDIMAAGKEVVRAQAAGVPLSQLAARGEHRYELGVGERVFLADGRVGTVKFKGEVPELPSGGQWLGIQFDRDEDGDMVGLNDGSIQGSRYFSCKEGDGAFIREKRCTRMKGGKLQGPKILKEEKFVPKVGAVPKWKDALTESNLKYAQTAKGRAHEARVKAIKDKKQASKVKRSFGMREGSDMGRTSDKYKVDSSKSKKKSPRQQKKSPRQQKNSPRQQQPKDAKKEGNKGFVGKLREKVQAKGADKKSPPATPGPSEKSAAAHTPQGERPKSGRISEKVREERKGLIQQFMSVTGAAKPVAIKTLKVNDWQVEAAINLHLTSNEKGSRSSKSRPPASNTAALGGKSEADKEAEREKRRKNNENRRAAAARAAARRKDDQKENHPNSRSSFGSSSHSSNPKDKKLSNSNIKGMKKPVRGANTRTNDLSVASGVFKARQRAKKAQQALRKEKRERKKAELSTKSVAARAAAAKPGFGRAAKNVGAELNEFLGMDNKDMRGDDRLHKKAKGKKAGGAAPKGSLAERKMKQAGASRGNASPRTRPNPGAIPRGGKKLGGSKIKNAAAASGDAAAMRAARLAALEKRGLA